MANEIIREEVNMPEDDRFIPEVEIDPDTGKPKPRPFKQKEWQPLTDYGG